MNNPPRFSIENVGGCLENPTVHPLDEVQSFRDREKTDSQQDQRFQAERRELSIEKDEQEYPEYREYGSQNQLPAIGWPYRVEAAK